MINSTNEDSFSFIVPAYNPGAFLFDHILALLAVLQTTGYLYEVIVVDDGSTDGSIESLHQIQNSSLKIRHHKHNQGKGAAIKTGFSSASMSWIGFIDADGDIPASCILPLINVAIKESPDIILGSKSLKQSDIHSSFYRKILSKSFQLAVRSLFKLPVKDTQTGLKLFKRTVVTTLEPYLKENGYAFDLEFVVLANQLGFRNIVEVPVKILKRRSSTLSYRQVIHVASDTLRVFLRLKKTKL